MGTLATLYQDLILDHNRAPRNYREIDNANRKAEGHNPLCGDRLTVWLQMKGDLIEDAAHRAIIEAQLRFELPQLLHPFADSCCRHGRSFLGLSPRTPA